MGLGGLALPPLGGAAPIPDAHRTPGNSFTRGAVSSPGSTEGTFSRYGSPHRCPTSWKPRQPNGESDESDTLDAVSDDRRAGERPPPARGGVRFRGGHGRVRHERAGDGGGRPGNRSRGRRRRSDRADPRLRDGRPGGGDRSGREHAVLHRVGHEALHRPDGRHPRREGRDRPGLPPFRPPRGRGDGSGAATGRRAAPRFPHPHLGDRQRPDRISRRLHGRARSGDALGSALRVGADGGCAARHLPLHQRRLQTSSR